MILILYWVILIFYTMILIIDGMILIFDLDHFLSDLLYLCKLNVTEKGNTVCIHLNGATEALIWISCTLLFSTLLSSGETLSCVHASNRSAQFDQSRKAAVAKSQYTIQFWIINDWHQSYTRIRLPADAEFQISPVLKWCLCEIVRFALGSGESLVQSVWYIRDGLYGTTS